MAGTSAVTGGAASISLNFGSACRRGAADSPVQQQETEMKATADAQRARRGRIMGQAMVGKYRCGGGGAILLSGGCDEVPEPRKQKSENLYLEGFTYTCLGAGVSFAQQETEMREPAAMAARTATLTNFIMG